MAKQYIVRDMRRKEKFQVDDEYINGYAKLCGIYATGVYMTLCRHANTDQEAWPSTVTIAEKLNISPRSVIGGIAKLERFGLIGVIRDRNAKGHRTVNVYVLIDKSLWLSKTFDLVTVVHAAPSAPYARNQVHEPGARDALEGNKRKETKLKERKLNKLPVDNGKEPTSIKETIDQVRGQLVMQGVLQGDLKK